MSDLNKAVEKIIMYKANKMKTGLKPNTKFNKHIKAVLGKDGTKVSDEQVQNFIVGAVDAMIYDVGQELGYDKKKSMVDDWASFKKRQEILKKIFPDAKAKKAVK